MNFNRTIQFFLGYLTVSMFLKSAMTQSRASLGIAMRMNVTNLEETSLSYQPIEFNTINIIQNNLRGEVNLAKRRLTGPLGTEFQVNTFTANSQGAPAIAVLTDGSFVIVWDSFLEDGSDEGIFGQKYTASGSKDGSEFQVNTYTSLGQRWPDISPLIDGGFIIVWSSNSQDGSNYGVFGQKYNSNGARIGLEFQINTYVTGKQGTPSIATLNNGDFIVVWPSFLESGSCYGIFGQRYTIDCVKNGIEFQVNTYVLQNSGGSYISDFTPAITALNDGGFVIIWESVNIDGNGYGISGQRYGNDGVRNGAEFQVNTYTTNSQGAPAIATLTAGGFVVTWDSDKQDGSGYGVFGQRFTASGFKNGAEFQINTYTSLEQHWPDISPLTDGGFIASWSSYSQDGSYYGCFGQKYNVNGVKSGLEFQVNTNIADTQDRPSIAMINNGNFIIVWQSNNQDGSGNGIFGQRFDANNNKIALFSNIQPTLLPTAQPSQPTFQPTLRPTFLPITQPTFRPSVTPTFLPTFYPTNATSTINDKENKDLTSFYLTLFLCLGGAIGLIGLIYMCCRKNKSIHTAPYQVLELNKIDLKDKPKPSAPPFSENQKEIKAVNSTSIPIISWGDLVLGKELGKGSFGVVSKALWLKTTDVAVKKLLKALTQDLLEEFKKETEVHMHLRHPNVIMLYGICLAPPHFGMVLEFMANGSLDQVLQRPGECSLSTRLTFALEMVSGLLYLHSKNIVHRDLKSLNVLIDEHMHAKIADFGLAKIRHSTETLTVGPMGTPCWMAPELFDEGACDKTTDIYATGIIFWEIAARKKPYEGKTLAQLIKDLMNGKREKIPAETPQKFAALITRCWAQRAEERPTIENVVQNMQDIKRTYG